MADKIKDFLDKTFSLAKLKPTIFMTMLFNIIYGSINAIISAVQLSVFIGITGAYSIIFGIAKFYGLNSLKKTQGKSETEIIKIEKTAATNISIYAAAMSFLHFSLAVVCIFFVEEDPANYALWFIYFISIADFVKIILAAVNTIRTRKNHNIIIHHLKLMDFANALISLALLQRAVLYFSGYENARLIGGIGGVFFSLCAMLICLRMFFRFTKRGNKKDGITDRLN